MRKWSWVLGAFLAVGAVGCEDSSPKKIEAPIVRMETPKVEAPKFVEAPKPIVEPKVEIADETTDDQGAASDNDMKPMDVVGAAREAMSRGALDRAFTLAKLGVKKAPNRSAAWNMLGRIQLTRGERTSARESFEKAVELNPKSSYAQNNLGLVLIYQGKYDDAVEALESATDLEPVESYMWNNLGMAYEHLDRLEEARDAYQKAAELSSPNAKDSLARLEGVKSVFRTAKADVTYDAPDGGN